jgi:putative flippase GtrA
MSNDPSKKALNIRRLWRRLDKKIIKFSGIGALCASLNLGTLYLLTNILNFNYLISTLIALFLINFIGFYLNKYYTFQTKKKRFWQELWKYYSVMFSSFILNLIFMYLLVDILHIWYLYASLSITICFIVFNYLMHKNWSFK